MKIGNLVTTEFGLGIDNIVNKKSFSYFGRLFYDFFPHEVKRRKEN